MIVHLFMGGANFLCPVFAGDRSHADIFIHRQMFENPASLGYHDSPEPHHGGAEPVCDVLARKADMSAFDVTVFRLEQSADGPQGGGLSGPVGAQQGHDQSFGHL